MCDVREACGAGGAGGVRGGGGGGVRGGGGGGQDERMRMPWCRRGWATLGVTLVMVSACASGTQSGGVGVSVPASGCAPAVNERLDPRSSVHLFPGAREPQYPTDPPTSGPHRLGPPFLGVVTSPIARPSQVAMLESGFVILQYQGLPASQVAALGTLAGDLVTVAPPARPLPSPVVATAWTWKLECGSGAPAALDAIKSFVDTHRGVGFAGDIPVTTPPT